MPGATCTEEACSWIDLNSSGLGTRERHGGESVPPPRLGASTVGMPPLWADEAADGVLAVYNGVARAAGVAELSPGALSRGGSRHDEAAGRIYDHAHCADFAFLETDGMPKNYTVQPGDTLSKIASKHGFKDYREIYDHPSNASFRAKRPNPKLIFPGDVIVIPEIVVPDKEENEFDIDFKLLPPRLQMQLWVLALDANTSKVNLAYRSGSFVTSLAYNYGGNVEASLSVRRVSITLGVDPASGDTDLGLVFRGFKFGASASLTRRSYGLGIGYGASLLPFPWELSSTFNSAAGGLQNMAGNIGSAPNNPLAWYNLHSDDAAAIGNAVSAGQKIAKHGEDSNRFGAGLRLNYTPQTGLTIYGGAQLRF